MKTAHTATALQAIEIELKLALPANDPVSLEATLRRLPLLARRKPHQTHLHNVYYDTPDDALNRQRVALRVRRTGNDTHPQWLQTLKTGGSGGSALSQRGEWETEVPGPKLQMDMLQPTPWQTLDPDGAIFQSLLPRFTTRFDRTQWTVRTRDGSIVEVALDRGEIQVDDRSAAICELEIELLSGQPRALFSIAHQIAAIMPVMPLGVSKAQRGYALAGNCLEAPQRSNPVTLKRAMSKAEAARSVLHEALGHFIHNLHVLRTSDDPEVVHQVRIGWRRFKSARKLFGKTPLTQRVPSWRALAPLLNALGQLRDLEVANLETLPMLANGYTEGKRKRQDHWRTLQLALVAEADQQRLVVRSLLQNPVVGATLLNLTEWLESDRDTVHPPETRPRDRDTLPSWAKRRIKRLRDRLKSNLRKATTAADLHSARILAKRVRYGVEALQSVLPHRRAQHWLRQSAHLQGALGGQRDLERAVDIATRLQAHADLLQFLQTVAARRKRLHKKRAQARARQV